MDLFPSIALSALIIFSSSAIALPVYSLVELPSVGRSFATPMAINTSGIVVGSVPFGNGEGQAFSTDGVTMTNIGTVLGTTRSIANDINNSGQIVGIDFGDGSGSFLYVNGVVTKLPTLGGPHTWASGINDQGWIVGVSEDLRQKAQGFIYKNGTMSQLENLSSRLDATSNAKAINNNGVVVGTSLGTTDSVAVKWSSSGAITPLGTFGGSSSTAEAVNDVGQIVGYADYANPLMGHGAFIWQNGVMTDLGNLGGPGGAAATSINSAGHVVGSASASAGLGGGFIWTASDGMVALDTLLDPAFSSWQILQGQGINDSDQIVAYARASEGSPWTIVILTPIATEAVPAPATAALLGIGLLGSLVTTKRHEGQRSIQKQLNRR